MTSTPASSRSAADRFGFEFCTGNTDDILRSDEINTVLIATRHDSHARYVTAALEAGKHVFVEKPLCLTLEELEEIRGQWSVVRIQFHQNPTSDLRPLTSDSPLPALSSMLLALRS